MAVVGGGPAGAAAARAVRLQDPALSVVIVEPAGSEEVEGTRRALPIGETLHPAALPLLQKLGLWPGFVAQGHPSAIGTSSVWGTDTPVADDFFTRLYKDGAFLDRRRFDALLLDGAVEAGACRIRTRFRAVERTEGGFVLTVDPGGLALPHPLDPSDTPTTLEARFVIDASGRRARVASALGVERVRDDQLVAIACTCEKMGSDARTRVEAVASGWWYSAPQAEGTVVVFCTDADLAREAQLRGVGAFQEHLSKTTYVREQVGAIRSGPRILPADSSALVRPAGPGWVAVGDAALAYDPLSGQGLLKALRHAFAAAFAAAEHLKGGDGVAARYGHHLATERSGYREARLRAYEPERRFSGSPFWQRRQPRLTLAPDAILALGPLPQSTVLHLCPSEHRCLVGMLTEARPAHAILREARRLGFSASNADVLHALQAMVAAGALVVQEKLSGTAAP